MDDSFKRSSIVRSSYQFDDKIRPDGVSARAICFDIYCINRLDRLSSFYRHCIVQNNTFNQIYNEYLYRIKSIGRSALVRRGVRADSKLGRKLHFPASAEKLAHRHSESERISSPLSKCTPRSWRFGSYRGVAYQDFSLTIGPPEAFRDRLRTANYRDNFEIFRWLKMSTKSLM